jgi:hypothetical protein
VFSSRKRGEADRRCDETAQGTQPMQKMQFRKPEKQKQET